MEDESLSPFFNLDRGNAQGDNISPFSFNIGFQILIFKLNFDLQIARLNDPLVIPPLIVDPHIVDPPAPVTGLERKAFSFADDGSCLTLLEPNSLVRIYNILEIFGSLSGLVCNVEKTALVVIGHEGPLDPRIADIGFTLQTEVTILGLKIKGDNYDFSETFDGFCDKIRKIIQHWARFNLSLPGRINVAKCFLYSQLNYIGCFLTIPQNYLTVIQNLIETFIIGNLKLAKKRLYAKPEDGGLGLFQMNEFLEAQQCQWIKRAKNMDEIWKQKLYVKCKGDISNAKSKYFDQTTEPTLYNIVKCYEKFSINFTKYKENFWLANLFENKALPINFRLQNCLTEEELGFDTFLNFGTLIRKLTIEQLYLPTRSRMMSRAQVMEHLGIQFTPEDFEKIKKICNNAKLKYTKNKIDEKKSISVNGFLALKTKGSKIFRKILLNQTKSSITKNIVKFAETTETFINLEESKLLNKCWYYNFFSNSTRTFLFKFYNNILGYNAAVSHFVRGQSSNCTFCILNRNPDPNRELALHLFFNCPAVSRILDQTFSYFLGEETNVSRHEIFVQFKRFTQQKNEILFYIGKIFLKAIWDCKVRQHLPELNNIINQINQEMVCLMSLNKEIRAQVANSGFNFDAHL